MNGRVSKSSEETFGPFSGQGLVLVPSTKIYEIQGEILVLKDAAHTRKTVSKQSLDQETFV